MIKRIHEISVGSNRPVFTEEPCLRLCGAPSSRTRSETGGVASDASNNNGNLQKTASIIK